MIDKTTGYMCHDWTLKEQSQVDSSSEREVCEGLGLISTDGVFTFPNVLLYQKAKTHYLQLGGGAFLSLWLHRKLLFDIIEESVFPQEIPQLLLVVNAAAAKYQVLCFTKL